MQMHARAHSQQTPRFMKATAKINRVRGGGSEREGCTHKQACTGVHTRTLTRADTHSQTRACTRADAHEGTYRRARTHTWGYNARDTVVGLVTNGTPDSVPVDGSKDSQAAAEVSANTTGGLRCECVHGCTCSLTMLSRMLGRRPEGDTHALTGLVRGKGIG